MAELSDDELVLRIDRRLSALGTRREKLGDLARLDQSLLLRAVLKRRDKFAAAGGKKEPVNQKKPWGVSVLAEPAQ